MKKSAHGFTLVELLVVVAIIAVLSVIGIVIFSGVQKNARDARRKEDINNIASAMEANIGTGGQYTALAGTMFSSGTVPVDPVNTSAATTDSACPTVCKYCYSEDVSTGSVTSGACTNASFKITTSAGMTGGTKVKWVVCANLETTTAPTYYCRQNQQ